MYTTTFHSSILNTWRGPGLKYLWCKVPLIFPYVLIFPCYWQNNQAILSAIKIAFLRKTLNWSCKFIFQMTVMCRILSVYTLPFHLFILLFFVASLHFLLHFKSFFKNLYFGKSSSFVLLFLREQYQVISNKHFVLFLKGGVNYYKWMRNFDKKVILTYLHLALFQ